MFWHSCNHKTMKFQRSLQRKQTLRVSELGKKWKKRHSLSLYSQKSLCWHNREECVQTKFSWFICLLYWRGVGKWLTYLILIFISKFYVEDIAAYHSVYTMTTTYWKHKKLCSYFSLYITHRFTATVTFFVRFQNPIKTHWLILIWWLQLW